MFRYLQEWLFPCKLVPLWTYKRFVLSVYRRISLRTTKVLCSSLGTHFLFRSSPSSLFSSGTSLPEYVYTWRHGSCVDPWIIWRSYGPSTPEKVFSPDFKRRRSKTKETLYFPLNNPFLLLPPRFSNPSLPFHISLTDHRTLHLIPFD